MSVAAPPPKSGPSKNSPANPALSKSELRVSSYDRVASTIVALLILLGLAAGLLFLVWLTRHLSFHTPAVEIEMLEEAPGRGDHAPGSARDPEPPGADEIEELTEPQTQQSLEAVTDAVSSISGSTEAIMGGEVFAKGNGQGDSRRAGPLGEGDDIIPRSERWKFQYPDSTLTQYARILDYFKIELGALGGGSSQVDYAYNLTKSRPDRKSGAGKDEKRLFFIWTKGKLQEADRQLLSKAGISPSGRIIAQFLPPDTENTLANVEFRYKDRPAKEIKKTVFGVRREGNGYVYYVIAQEYI